jgi:hypothetical protein
LRQSIDNNENVVIAPGPRFTPAAGAKQDDHLQPITKPVGKSLDQSAIRFLHIHSQIIRHILTSGQHPQNCGVRF